MPIQSMSCVKEPKTVLSLIRCPSRRCFAVPPRMQNQAQFGNLSTSSAQRVLIDVTRRCKACVVFLCLDRQRFVYSMMRIDNRFHRWVWQPPLHSQGELSITWPRDTNPPRRGGPLCPPAQNGVLTSVYDWLASIRQKISA